MFFYICDMARFLRGIFHVLLAYARNQVLYRLARIIATWYPWYPTDLENVILPVYLSW